MKKILINVNSLVRYSGATHLSGIGRSTYSLLNGLAKMDNLPFNIMLYSQRVKSGGLEGYNYPFSQLRVPLPNNPLFTKMINRSRIKETLTKYDLYHIPHNTDFVAKPQLTLFTIHDLMIYKFPEFFPFTQKFDKWAKKLMKDCKAIVTCSESSKIDICSFWNVPAEKITVIEWGIDRTVFYPAETKEIDEITTKLRIKHPYFLSISNSHPRKNLRLVLNGFREYSSENRDISLVILWNNPPYDLIHEIKDEVSSGKIMFVDHVNDNELRGLYSGAIATLFPSYYEGFGYPVLESLACHTPVITCANSSLKDLGADLAIYTSEDDYFEFASHLTDVTKCRQKYVLTNKIEDHLKRFDWRETCKRYIYLYDTLIG